jgi:LmbE family N-acetylglucosaminyl deacetylase
MIRIISPHIDDAVLSLGGFIANCHSRHVPIEVYNVFTITNWVNPELISVRGLDEQYVTALRKSEELLVSRMLNYRCYFWDYKDFVLRTKDAGSENALAQEIKHRIAALVSDGLACFFPGGTGHPDHEIINQIGLELLSSYPNIFFFEDQPYAAGADYDYQQMHAQLSATVEPVFEEYNKRTKVDVLKLYGSQVSESWIKDIVNYSYNLTTNTYQERFWRKKQ